MGFHLLLRKGFTLVFFFYIGYGYCGVSIKDTVSILRDTVIKIEARPDLGFNYPYFIRIPKGLQIEKKQFLLVETNNSGNNDSLSYHERETYLEVIKNSLGSSLCKKLKVPFLVPVFPRPLQQWKYYTHALDRDAALINEGEMKRLDLQLIAMIKNAAIQLKAQGIIIEEKILMNGFSASGTFANRFTLLHPNLVAGVACGGINAIPISPIAKIGSDNLIYPLGIYDLEKIFDLRFNSVSYKKVPQYIYMGGKDSNDAVLFDDAYSKKERKLVFKRLGKVMLPDRFRKIESIYKDFNTSAVFKLYPNIGHETDMEVFTDVVKFFSEIMQSH